MALGKFADRNLALTSVLSGGAWAAGLPLANLIDESHYVSAPARQTTPAVLANSQFDATLATARAVSLVAVLFHTLSFTAKYRISVAGATGSLAAPDYQSAWTDVYGRIYDSSTLEWEDTNWWSGTIAAEDIDLYRRHLWIQLPTTMIASAIRIEFDDSGNTASYFDLGGLWITHAWSPSFNFDRGRTLGMDARDQLDEAPSGRIFGEQRTPRRRVAVSWSNLADAEAQRLYDAGARARTTQTVLFLPDSDDPTSLVREAYPSTFGSLPEPTMTWQGAGKVEATFKEILA
jgi:hypothetical protein